MSTHNIGFYEDLKKIIFQLSSNTHLISSSEHECHLVGLVTMWFTDILIKVNHKSRKQYIYQTVNAKQQKVIYITLAASYILYHAIMHKQVYLV